MEGTRAEGEGTRAPKPIRKCVAACIHCVFDSRHSQINSNFASGMGGEESRRWGKAEGGRHEGRGRRSVYKKALRHVLGLSVCSVSLSRRLIMKITIRLIHELLWLICFWVCWIERSYTLLPCWPLLSITTMPKKGKSSKSKKTSKTPSLGSSGRVQPPEAARRQTWPGSDLETAPKFRCGGRAESRLRWRRSSDSASGRLAAGT